MGDTLMNLSAIRVLRQSYPKSWICLLADQSVAPLFRDHPDLDEVMSLDFKLFCRKPAYFFQILKKVKFAKFDLAVVSNAHKFLHALVFLAGIRRRAGYARKWSFLLNKKIADDKERASRHEMESNVALVKQVCVRDWDGHWEFPADSSAVLRIQERLNILPISEKGIVVIHAGSSNPAKRLPAERFAAVADWGLEKGFSVILIGGVEEKEVSLAVIQKIKDRVHDWTGQLSLEELTALFHDPRARALVSVDSGPVHVAWLSGTPVAALYAENVPGSHPSRWGPRDGKSEVIYKPMSDISVEEACKSLRVILNEPA